MSKYDNFIAALKALCDEHDVQLSSSRWLRVIVSNQGDDYAFAWNNDIDQLFEDGTRAAEDDER